MIASCLRRRPCLAPIRAQPEDNVPRTTGTWLAPCTEVDCAHPGATSGVRISRALLVLDLSIAGAWCTGDSRRSTPACQRCTGRCAQSRSPPTDRAPPATISSKLPGFKWGSSSASGTVLSIIFPVPGESGCDAATGRCDGKAVVQSLPARDSRKNCSPRAIRRHFHCSSCSITIFGLIILVVPFRKATSILLPDEAVESFYRRWDIERALVLDNLVPFAAMVGLDDE